MKKIFPFGRRNYQWWGFTLLPIIIMVPIVLIYNWKFKNYNQVLILLLQQLSAYSIILSSTDLGLKFKSKDRIGPVFVPLIMIIFSSIILTCVYMFQEDIIISSKTVKLIFLLASVFCDFFSIKCYYNNPESFDISPQPFIETHVKQEEEAKKTFDSPKTDTKIDAKWGEGNE